MLTSACTDATLKKLQATKATGETLSPKRMMPLYVEKADERHLEDGFDHV